jgi:precorrin-4 C11-methyltransferase
MKTAIINITKAGCETALKLHSALHADTLERTSVGKFWNDYDAFVFVGAMGICVRTIAPHIEDKHTDPAVVCVDSMGRNAIAVLSGHVGGANELTRQIADAIGAHEVITTQSDMAGLWSLDTLDRQFGWVLQTTADMNRCIFDFVNHEPTALLLKAHDEGTQYLLGTMPEHVTRINSIEEASKGCYRLLIIVSPYVEHSPAGIPTLHYVPRMATVGFGLAHRAEPAQEILNEMHEAMEQQGLMPYAKEYCTIDVKADEPLVRLLRDRGETVRLFTSEELAAIPVPHPSDTVARHVGTPSVSEAAALLGAGHGASLVMTKVKGANWTAAVAIGTCKAMVTGHIEIVGAGPGDADLISVRGRKMLERADLILYAGSLVPRALTECHKPGAVVRSSAGMNLEEQCALMKEHYDKGHFIVRLHTGDPCIFGAIQEQMAFFDREAMDYHITPGISSFLAAAAELRSQFTIPERTQTIILTRGEGRTPMPEKEQLHLLARSQSTMCIFLSAAIVDDVQRELLTEYPEDTPVAACYHLTWPDQRIYRGKLKDLSKIVRDNNLTLTTMLVVGEAIDNRRGLSLLYDRHFTHLFRKSSTD